MRRRRRRTSSYIWRMGVVVVLCKNGERFALITQESSVRLLLFLMSLNFLISASPWFKLQWTKWSILKRTTTKTDKEGERLKQE